MYDPKISEWAQRDMDRTGMDIDEYCNDNGYNVYDILDEEDDDDDDY